MNSAAYFFLLLLVLQQQVRALMASAGLSFNSSATTCDTYKNDHDKCMASSEDGIPCSYCTSAAVGALCAKQTDTKGLPPSVFKCEYQEPTAVATTCDTYKNDHDKCMTSSEDGIPCSYCTSAAVGALCAKQTDTKGLPPSVFKCKYQEPTAVVAWPPPEPTYSYLTCGTVWESNVTFVNYDLIDYFAVVNATTFTVVATNWEVIVSNPSCEDGVTLGFWPIIENDESYGPQEYYFKNGESFKFIVNPVKGMAEQFDMFFAGSGGTCDWTVKMTQIEIVC